MARFVCSSAYLHGLRSFPVRHARKQWRRLTARRGCCFNNWINSTDFCDRSTRTGILWRDFRFEYVAQSASRLLPWQYCLSALWVGQAGSLLLWAWMMAVMAVLLHITAGASGDVPRTAFGLVMGNVCFLVAVMVFAADPMAPNLTAADEGAGLSPLLQHPSMLIHPPIVFLSYAAWTVPCALALGALLLRPIAHNLDTVGPAVGSSGLDPVGSWFAPLCIGHFRNSDGEAIGVGILSKRLALALAYRNRLHSQPPRVATSRLSEKDCFCTGDYYIRVVQFCHVSHSQWHF